VAEAHECYDGAAHQCHHGNGGLRIHVLAPLSALFRRWTFVSFSAPQRESDAHAGIADLRRGDVRVFLRRRDAGVAEDLLHNADVYALFDEERSSDVPGVV
jgi:hypothetical protein